MSLFSVFLIGIGLSMDACAVSFAKGICLKKQVKTYALKLGLAFGFFQAMMPLIGWWVGTYFESFITAVDHWIAFFLLLAIGLNMIRESLDSDDEYIMDTFSFKELTLLAVATSIDAFAVGITFALLNMSLLLPCTIIGIVAFIFSISGIFIGKKLGNYFGDKFEILGGAVLILIGIKILLGY